jgi:hypothetical protein
MSFDPCKFTVYSPSTTIGKTASPVVPSSTEDAATLPFTVRRHDLRTGKRILSRWEREILNVIGIACKDLFSGPRSRISTRADHYVKCLVRLRLGRGKSQRVMAVIQNAAELGIGWTDQTRTEVVNILEDRLHPATKPAHLLAVLPVGHARLEFPKLRYITHEQLSVVIT